MSAKIDTTPDYPEQHLSLVELAERDLPAVLQDMPNEKGSDAGDPGHGHRVVLAERLVETMAGEKGHARAAAAWAVHRLAERGLLRCEVACGSYPRVVGHRQVPGRVMFGVQRSREEPVYDTTKVPLADPAAGPVPYSLLLVYSTTELWDWWRSPAVGGHDATPSFPTPPTQPVRPVSQIMPPTDPSSRLQALLQQAAASRGLREEQERRDEERRQSSECFIGVLNDVRQATPELLAGRPESQAEAPGDAQEQFYTRWACLFVDLGRELTAAGLQHQLGELDDYVKNRPDAEAGQYAASLIRLSCRQDRQEVEQFLRAAGEAHEFRGVRMWLHQLAGRLAEMRNRIWAESLSDAAEQQLHRQPAGPAEAVHPLSQQVREALDGLRAVPLLAQEAADPSDGTPGSAGDLLVEQMVRLGDAIRSAGLDAALARRTSNNEIVQRAIEMLRLGCASNRAELNLRLQHAGRQGQTYEEWLRYWLRKVVQSCLVKGQPADILAAAMPASEHYEPLPLEALSPGSAMIDTTPDVPKPTEMLIQAAARAVPEALAGMQNEAGGQYEAPAARHRVVMASKLVHEVVTKGGHYRPAAAWAVHRLILAGMLEAELLQTRLPPIEGQPGPVYGNLCHFPKGTVPYDHLLVRSAEALWDWRRDGCLTLVGSRNQMTNPPTVAKVPMKASFGWLHLTDLHFGMSGQKWLWPNIREEFFSDLEKLHSKSGPWDLVLFTGDFVQKGGADEFKGLNELLVRLWEHLRGLGSDPYLLGVPGNHDLVRPNPGDAEVAALRNGWNDPEVRREFWGNPKSGYRKVVQKALKNYVAWWNSHSLPRLGTHKAGLLPGDFSATLEKDGIKVGFVGLNTTFLQLEGGDYERRLAVSPQQFHHACGGDGVDWVKGHQVCLLLTHQPPHWLTPDSRRDFNGEIAKPGRFAAHLFGHMHEAAARTQSHGGADTRREWQGCSLFGLEDWGGKKQRLHGYSAGRIELDGEGGTIRQWPRSAFRHQAEYLHIVADPSYSLELRFCKVESSWRDLGLAYTVGGHFIAS